MANKRFLESIKGEKSNIKPNIPNNTPVNVSDLEEEEDSNSFSYNEQVEAVKTKEIEEEKVLSPKIEELESIPEEKETEVNENNFSLDLDVPEISSLSLNDSNDLKEIKPRRGRKKLSEINQNDVENVIEKENVEKTDEIKSIVKEDVVDVKADKTYHCEISDEVLQFVCDRTIANLINSYTSNVYTKDFTLKLFNGYLNKDKKTITSELFKELIAECIESKTQDPYLEGLTEKVLEFIKRS